MSKSVEPDRLHEALVRQLDSYHEDVVERLNDVGREAMKRLVKLTKATAPVKSGNLKRDITSTEQASGVYGAKEFIWHAKHPSSSVLHLAVNGHATRNGDYVPGNPFLHNAWDKVRPEYEAAVEEAVKE